MIEQAMLTFGPLSMAMAKFTVASEVARRQQVTFAEALDVTEYCWPAGSTLHPTTEQEWLEAFEDITYRATCRVGQDEQDE